VVTFSFRWLSQVERFWSELVRIGHFHESEFGKKFYFHGLQSAWDIIKSGKA